MKSLQTKLYTCCNSNGFTSDIGDWRVILIYIYVPMHKTYIIHTNVTVMTI